MSRLASFATAVAALLLSGCATTTANPCVATDRAPATYRASVETTRGTFVVEVHRDWAPQSADRFYELACSGFYSEARFYRVIPEFVAQFGMSAEPSLYAKWTSRPMTDEPALRSNTRGTLAFTGSAAKNSRTTHVYINLADNPFLDATGAPFGQVVSGMDVVEALYSGYGENAPVGGGPEQQRLWGEGNAYLRAEFPKLDSISRIALEP